MPNVCMPNVLLQELLPINKRTPEIFTSYFREAGLQQIVDYQVRLVIFNVEIILPLIL